MKRQRRGPVVLGQGQADPFRDGTEAWFWTMACLTARQDGARIIAGLGAVPRPCEPDDVILQVQRLHRDGGLATRHVEVLADYGRQGIAPDAGRPAQARDAHLWEAALPVLEKALKARGIVA